MTADEHDPPVANDSIDLAPPGRIVGVVVTADGEAWEIENHDGTRVLWKPPPRPSVDNSSSKEKT